MEQAQALGVTEVTTTPAEWLRRAAGHLGNWFAELCLHFAFCGFHLSLSFPSDSGEEMCTQSRLRISVWELGTAGFHVEHWGGDTK